MNKIRSYVLLLFFVFSFCFSIFSCKEESSDTEVANGLIAGKDDFSSVVQLRMNGGKCTGSIISDNVILTAAHCTEDDSGFKVVIDDEDKITIDAKYTQYNRRFNSIGSQTDTPQYDISVWVFDDDTFYDSDKLEIMDTKFKVGDEVLAVGYGCNTTLSYSSDVQCSIRNHSSGKKYGYNTIEEIKDSYSRIFITSSTGTIDSKITKPTGEDVMTTEGDSGGPLLLKADPSKIIGVVSGGNSSIEDKVLVSVYSNPAYSSNMQVLENVVDTTNAIIPGVQVAVKVVEYNGKVKVIRKLQESSFNKNVSADKIIKSYNGGGEYPSVSSLKQAWRNTDFYSRSSATWDLE